MDEVWKPVVGYEGIYDVSNLGKVRSVKTGKIRRTSYLPKPSPGYESVALWVNNRQWTIYVHFLVLSAFVGPRPTGMWAAHLDGNPKNNSLNNLRWVTPSENQGHKNAHGTANQGERNPAAQLTEALVADIRRLAGEGVMGKDIAERFSLSKQQVSRIILRHRWKYLR